MLMNFAEKICQEKEQCHCRYKLLEEKCYVLSEEVLKRTKGKVAHTVQSPISVSRVPREMGTDNSEKIDHTIQLTFRN